MPKDDRILADIQGKPVYINWQGMMPASFGSTVIELEPRRIVERTRFLFGQRETQVDLSKVEGVQFLTQGNMALIVIGLLTLPLFGLGIIFLILGVFLRYRYIGIQSPGLLVGLRVTGDQDRALDFIDRVMAQIEKNAKSQPLSIAPPVVEAAPPPAPERSSRLDVPPQQVRAIAAPTNLTIRCTSCGTELAVPPGPPGRKFRCPSCKEIVKAD